MELKSLELFGFKSFADRTRFEFDSGVTVIVGPNGCGKSNVVDAVKWVLGEQSAKSLRGREMADVIFAGSESRRSLGFAEATLAFDNSRGLLPIDVTEVEVTRRLYRSGESEYLLNRKPCRLRDLRELFMDTGIGVDAYSLIEQGKVDVLLQLNPQERRIIFEEAAGISKYKAKRREAARKLDRTEQNLLRLGDILEEVERRLRSVKYQAGKARNYLAYTDRLKELRVFHALNQYHGQVSALADHGRRIEELRDQGAAHASALANLDQERARLESERMDLEQQARTAEARLGDIRSEIATRESEIGFHATRLGELEQVVERDRRKIGDLTVHRRQVEAQIESRRDEMASVAGTARERESDLESIEARLRDVSREVRAVTERIERAKSALMELAQQKSRCASRLGGLRLRLETVEAQADKLRGRRGEITAGLEALAERETDLSRRMQEFEDTIVDRRGRFEAERRRAEARQKELERVGERLARAKEELSALESRRQVLEDLERRGEGIPAAVRRVGEAIRAADHAPRWRGMVADLIEVDIEHAVVIESALGATEKLLIADRQADVLALARQLEGQLPGQVRFLALDAIEPVSDGKDLSAYPEAVGWAMDYIRVDEAVRPAIEHLLARTVVVRTLEGAVELARGRLRGYRFVSVSGNILEADGSVAVGPPGPETSLISRRSQLRDIALQRATAASRIEELQSGRNRAVADLQRLDREQQRLRQDIYEASMAKVEVEAQLRRLAETRQEFRAEAPVVESELADLARQREAMTSECGSLREELEQLARRAADGQAGVDGLTAEQETLLQRRAAFEEQRTQARVTLAQLRERHTALVDQLAAHERDLAATVEGIEQGRADLAQCHGRIRESERTMLRLQSELSGLFLEKEVTEAQGRRLAAERAARREAMNDLAAKARGLETEVQDVQQQIHALELEGRELQTKRDDLVQRIRDDFGMDLAERHAQWQPEEVDWDAVAEEIREVQGKIERLGAVNLDAIEEQEALEQRAEFLRRQRDDLVSARETLQNLIERINRESRERFLSTFEAVRGHFQELFRRLFGGGKADVFLEDETDVLESGIEIVARPPGKQLQRISLLSGGEKTMTAVAILLAIFRAKPSPFCILDEVDATLDEANVDRFTALVKDFLDQSQFIVISHNKRTMSIADVLYGVTMQEPGVSRKVGVKFSDLHEEGLVSAETDEAAAAGTVAEGAEPPAASAQETPQAAAVT